MPWGQGQPWERRAWLIIHKAYQLFCDYFPRAHKERAGMSSASLSSVRATGLVFWAHGFCSIIQGIVGNSHYLCTQWQPWEEHFLKAKCPASQSYILVIPPEAFPSMHCPWCYVPQCYKSFGWISWYYLRKVEAFTRDLTHWPKKKTAIQGDGDHIGILRASSCDCQQGIHIGARLYGWIEKMS